MGREKIAWYAHSFKDNQDILKINLQHGKLIPNTGISKDFPIVTISSPDYKKLVLEYDIYSYKITPQVFDTSRQLIASPMEYNGRPLYRSYGPVANLSGLELTEIESIFRWVETFQMEIPLNLNHGLNNPINHVEVPENLLGTISKLEKVVREKSTPTFTTMRTSFPTYRKSTPNVKTDSNGPSLIIDYFSF